MLYGYTVVRVCCPPSWCIAVVTCMSAQEASVSVSSTKRCPSSRCMYQYRRRSMSDQEASVSSTKRCPPSTCISTAVVTCRSTTKHMLGRRYHSPGRTYITCWAVIPFTAAESIGHTVIMFMWRLIQLCIDTSHLAHLVLYQILMQVHNYLMRRLKIFINLLLYFASWLCVANREQSALHVHIIIDKFAPFHNQMSVIHNIFVKFLQTIYFYKAEGVRKIVAQLNFQYTGCHIWYLG